MKASLIVSLGALGLGLAALAVTLTNSAAPPVGGGPSLRGAPAAGSAELLARVEALEARYRELSDRLERLARRPLPEARTPVATDAASRAELEDLQEQVRAAITALGADADGTLAGPPSAEFVERVSAAIAEIRVREATDQARRRVESRLDRLQDRMPWAAEQLGLSWQQQTAVESALGAMYERQEDYAVLWARGDVADKAEFGPIVEGDLELFLDELSGIMTPGQYQAYLALEGGELFPGSGGGK